MRPSPRALSARLCACLAAWLLAACLCLAPAPARAGEPGALSCESETLDYTLRWGLIPVGSATLASRPLDGVCELAVTARSNLLTDLVAEVRDEVLARVDLATGRPLTYRKSLHEGRLRREYEVFHLWDAGTRRQEADGGPPVFLPAPGRHDPLSVLYHFRYRPFEVPGDEASLPVSDGRALGTARAVFRGRERTLIAGRWVRVLRFDFDQGGTDGLLRTAPGAVLRILVTDDALRIPVLIKGRVVIAGFEGEFTGMLLRARRGGELVLEF